MSFCSTQWNTYQFTAHGWLLLGTVFGENGWVTGGNIKFRTIKMTFNRQLIKHPQFFSLLGFQFSRRWGKPIKWSEQKCEMKRFSSVVSSLINSINNDRTFVTAVSVRKQWVFSRFFLLILHSTQLHQFFQYSKFV